MPFWRGRTWTFAWRLKIVFYSFRCQLVLYSFAKGGQIDEKKEEKIRVADFLYRGKGWMTILINILKVPGYSWVLYLSKGQNDARNQCFPRLSELLFFDA